MGFFDRIPGPKAGYRWLNSQTPTVQLGLFIGSFMVFASLGSLPRPTERTPAAAIITIGAFLAMLIAILSLASLVYPWLVETTRRVRLGVFIGAITAVVLLPRGGMLETISMGLSFVLLVVAGLVVWSLGSEFRRHRNQKNPTA